MTYEETLAALVIITGFFPHSFTMSDPAIVDLWHLELEAFDAPAVEAAVRHLCRTKDAFPSLKDVLDRLGTNTQPTTAWRLACETARAIGATYRAGQVIERPALPLAVAAAAEAVGGLAAIRVRTQEAEPAMRAHFFRAFEEATVQEAAGNLKQLVATAGPAQLADVVRQATMAIGRPLTLKEQATVKREGGAA